MYMIVSLLVAAIVDGPPFALTTNGGSLDGNLRMAEASSHAEAVFRDERDRSWPR